MPWWSSINMNQCVHVKGPNKIKDMLEFIFLHILSSMETKKPYNGCAIYHKIGRIIGKWFIVWTSTIYSSFWWMSNFDNFVRCVLFKRGSSPIIILIYHRYGANKVNRVLLKEVIHYDTSHGVEEIKVIHQLKLWSLKKLRTCRSTSF